MSSEATAQAASGLPPAFPARAPPLSSKGLKYINFLGCSLFLEHLSRHRDLGHLESDVAAVADNLRADLDQLLAQAGQRPWLRRPGHCQRAHEVLADRGHPIGGDTPGTPLLAKDRGPSRPPRSRSNSAACGHAVRAHDAETLGFSSRSVIFPYPVPYSWRRKRLDYPRRDTRQKHVDKLLT